MKFIKRLVKFGLIVGLFLVVLNAIVGYFVDPRALINFLIADMNAGEKKLCAKNITEFGLENTQPVIIVLQRADNLGWATEPRKEEYYFPQNGISFVTVSVEKRVYRIALWTELGQPYNVRKVEIKVTEGQSLGMVTDVCFVPNRIVLSEVRNILKQLDLEVVKGDRLGVEFVYGLNWSMI